MVFTLLYFAQFLTNGASSFLSPAEELHKELRCDVVSRPSHGQKTVRTARSSGLLFSLFTL